MRLLFCMALLLVSGWAYGADKPFEMSYPYLNTFDYFGPGQIEIQQGKENKFIFKAPKQIRDMFQFKYSDGSLSVSPKRFHDLSEIPDVPHVILIVSNLQKLVLEGDNYVDIDYLKTDNFMVDIKLNGSTVLEGTVEAERFAISIAGSSQATIRGGSRFQSVMVNGPGLYDGKDFETMNTNVRLIGPSSCLVNVKDELSVSIQGYGHVHYYGSPKIHKSVKGEGVVSPLTKEIIQQFEEKK
ncbi:GIN domain-containing protein [Simkania sp.]|uniref:GIN domain-containing protein n=1 Tax=Simkania sp. TaxID=34094 RepID=UPI003B52382F